MMMNDESEALVKLAMADLQKRTATLRSAVQVSAVRPTQFRDTSLGVKEPGRMYAQVITPGYVITLKAGGATYEYHGAGKRVVLASKKG
jgi:hypothetical protein